MYKIVILGCENSHAHAFMNYIYGEKKSAESAAYSTTSDPIVNDVEVIGIYSDEREEAEKLGALFNVPVMENYDELAGKVDGVIITARHGDNHYKYAKPYIASGVPMFIDKPITISEDEARVFCAELKNNNIKVSGGSSCGLLDTVKKFKKIVETGELGKVYGGSVRAPINRDAKYGGFFFYSQHLVQMMGEIFGYYPESVTAIKHENHYNCMFNYKDYSVSGTYVSDNYNYCAGIDCENSSLFESCNFEAKVFVEEFMNYYNLLKGGEMHESYEDFFAPVFILNATARAIESGKCEGVNKL